MNAISTVAPAALAALIVWSSVITGAAAGPRSFATPEDAVKSLIAAANAGSLDELKAIFGPESQDLIASSDPATGRRNREVFVIAVTERWRLVDEGKGKTLVIGYEDWPFPVPLVTASGSWHFDTAAGKEEIIARRIGRNELSAIDTCRAYVTAQQRYAQQGHDGLAAGVYAKSFASDPGKENGLYWPTAHGQKPSPLGDLLAQAALDGRAAGAPPSPLNGYYYKILTSPGGFALVAWPAEYNVTGVMTFLVNQEGSVREKDLGTGTDAAARRMTAHNADSSWRLSQ
jgi:hypothetical protein